MISCTAPSKAHILDGGWALPRPVLHGAVFCHRDFFGRPTELWLRGRSLTRALLYTLETLGPLNIADIYAALGTVRENGKKTIRGKLSGGSNSGVFKKTPNGWMAGSDWLMKKSGLRSAMRGIVGRDVPRPIDTIEYCNLRSLIDWFLEQHGEIPHWRGRISDRRAAAAWRIFHAAIRPHTYLPKNWKQAEAAGLKFHIRSLKETGMARAYAWAFSMAEAPWPGGYEGVPVSGIAGAYDKHFRSES